VAPSAERDDRADAAPDQSPVSDASGDSSTDADAVTDASASTVAASDDSLADADLPVRDARLDGRRVAYAEYGAPDGDPVVFFHGTPGSHLLGALLDRSARRDGVRVLAPDRPGYGRSDSWPERTLADTGSLLAAVLADAGVDSARLVGFSGGGPHALAAAVTRPGLVERVDVIGGPAPPSLAAETPAGQRLLGALAERTPRLLGGLLRGHAALARRASPSVVVSQYAADPSAVDDEAAALVARDFVAALDRTREGVVTETRLLHGDWGVSLDALECPVRLWHGDADANAPVGDAERLAERLSDVRLTVFEGADHLGSLLRCRTALFDGDASETADAVPGGGA
jgi:pimeloyl-ACP methyl ester carboxylesterase